MVIKVLSQGISHVSFKLGDGEEKLELVVAIREVSLEE